MKYCHGPNLACGPQSRTCVMPHADKRGSVAIYGPQVSITRPIRKNNSFNIT